MTKLATAFELALPSRKPKVPAFRWLYASLRAEILEGRLRPGARLPSTRDLASQYELARGTIVSAFEQLKSEGYVEGSVGSGTYVSKVLPEKLLHVAPAQVAEPVWHGKRRPVISDYGQRASPFAGYENRPTRAFRANLPALDLFPTTLWTKITLRCLRRISRRQLMGCDPLGYLPLRQAVAEYLSRSRGVRCAAEQVAIVSGVQEALDLTARLLLNPGDRVCVENPGYPGAVLAFRAFCARILAVGVDDEGIEIRQLPAQGVRLIYVTPGHQFPLGTTMSLARRLELLEWARKSGALIFEDDYDSEYRYSGRPIPALQGLDSSGLVLYAGSFSKVLFPALRLGYMVIPSDLSHHFEAIQSLTCRHAPLLEQLVLTDFITEGHFGRHLRRMREVYAERLSVLLEEGHLRLRGLLEISGVEAGLQTAGWLSGGIDAESAAVAAAKRNVDVTPLDRYSQGRVVPEGLQLGFAAVDAKEIRRGVRELAIALEGARKALPRNSQKSQRQNTVLSKTTGGRRGSWESASGKAVALGEECRERELLARADPRKDRRYAGGVTRPTLRHLLHGSGAQVP
ncbi:MAG: PLP-dependent aminotransferase family protein [Candidatus Sulfotelmatobacter sp.]|jgi:GntR family transcriptional regulator/MocR family aminotransferase